MCIATEMGRQFRAGVLHALNTPSFQVRVEALKLNKDAQRVEPEEGECLE